MKTQRVQNNHPIFEQAGFTSRSILAGGLLLLLALFAVVNSAHATSGSLDVTFGSNGITIGEQCDLNGKCGAQSARGLASTSELGGLTVLGHRGLDDLVAFSTFDDGSAQPFFVGVSGDNGLSVNPTLDCPGHWSDAVMLQMGGDSLSLPGYVAAGSFPKPLDYGGGCGKARFHVAMMTAAGVIEPALQYYDDINGKPSEAFGVTRDASGRYVAVGRAGRKAVVVRLDSSMNPDASFGGGDGIVEIDLPLNPLAAPTHENAAYDVAVQADGKILVVGTVAQIDGAQYASPAQDWPYSGKQGFVARLLPNGTADGSVGGGTGRILFGETAEEFVASSVAVDEHGNILVGGKYREALSCGAFGCSGGWKGYVRRLDTDLESDVTFGYQPGKTVVDGILEDIAIDEAGNIVVVGSGGTLDQVDMFGLVMRLTPNGYVDATFGGGDGEVKLFEVSSWSGSRLSSVLLREGGRKIGVGGTLYNSNQGGVLFVARLLGGGCFDGVIDPILGETDTDGDGIEDSCDNCMDVCNPSQADSDGNCPAIGQPGYGSCGDACDACPAFDQENQTPAEIQACNGAEYNASNIDCCFASDSGAKSTDPICTGGGDVILEVGGGNQGGPGDAPGGAGIKVPANCTGATFAITAETKSQKQFWASTGPGTWVGAYDFSPDGADFSQCNPKPIGYIEWVDADDATKKIGNGVKGVNPNDISPYNYGIFENSIAVHWADKYGNGKQITDSCKQLACGAMAADGFPADWNGGTRKDDVSLKACCHKPTNRFFFEVDHFSAYGLIAGEEEAEEEACENTTSRTLLKVSGMDRPGNQKVVFKAEMDLDDAEGFFADPGARLQLANAAGDLLWENDTTASGRNPWRSNGRDMAKASLRGEGGSRLKVIVKVKGRSNPNHVEVKISGSRLDLPVENFPLPPVLEFEAARGESEFGCAKTDFSEKGRGSCRSNRSGSTVICKK